MISDRTLEHNMNIFERLVLFCMDNFTGTGDYEELRKAKAVLDLLIENENSSKEFVYASDLAKVMDFDNVGDLVRFVNRGY